MQLAMFSQLALHTSKGHRGVPFTVRGKTLCLEKPNLCVCVKVCEVMGCSEVVIRDPPLHKQCLSVSIYTICVCEVDDALRWSPVPFLSCVSACVCECVHCLCE